MIPWLRVWTIVSMWLSARSLADDRLRVVALQEVDRVGGVVGGDVGTHHLPVTEIEPVRPDA
jgi:hypothetical protein